MSIGNHEKTEHKPALVFEEEGKKSSAEIHEEDFRPFPVLQRFSREGRFRIKKEADLRSMESLIDTQTKEMSKKEKRIQLLEKKLQSMKDEQESNQKLYRRALTRASELENVNHDPELQNLFDGVTSLGNESWDTSIKQILINQSCPNGDNSLFSIHCK